MIKRALAKQADEYHQLLKEKDGEIARLIKARSKEHEYERLESALRQSNLEKLHLEKRLLSSSSALTTTTSTSDVGVSEKKMPEIIFRTKRHLFP